MFTQYKALHREMLQQNLFVFEVTEPNSTQSYIVREVHFYFMKDFQMQRYMDQGFAPAVYIDVPEFYYGESCKPLDKAKSEHTYIAERYYL